MSVSILEQYAPRPVFKDVVSLAGGIEERLDRYGIAREHGIVARHEMNEADQSIDYIIDHPPGQKVIQIYSRKGLVRLLDSHKAKLARIGKSGYSHANYFQGRLGEIVMHIILHEFFRKLAKQHAGFSYKAVRGKAGYSIAKNGEYDLVVGRNDNLFTYRRGMERAMGTLGEFDGLYEIIEHGIQSMVICEAKTASVSISTRKATRQGSPTHIEKVMEPIRSLFPDHRIFYLIMATRGRIVSNKYNYLIPRMAKKAEDILAAGVTPIFMPYCERAGDFEKMGRFVQQSLAKLVGIDIPLLREVTVNLESGRVQIGSSPKGMPLRFEYDQDGRWRLFGQDDDGRWYAMQKTTGGFELKR